MTTIRSLLSHSHYKMCIALQRCLSLIRFLLRSMLFQVSKILQMQSSFSQQNYLKSVYTFAIVLLL